MKSIVYFCLAAFFEIAGCFSFWAYVRQHRSAWWLAPGVVSLILFAGRAYAPYGGIYIAASLLWLWSVERCFFMPA